MFTLEHTAGFAMVEEREEMWYGLQNAPVAKIEYIPDVYTEIEKYVESDKIQIITFEKMPEERKEMLYGHIAKKIAEKNLLLNPDHKELFFIALISNLLGIRRKTIIY